MPPNNKLYLYGSTKERVLEQVKDRLPRKCMVISWDWSIVSPAYPYPFYLYPTHRLQINYVQKP